MRERFLGELKSMSTVTTVKKSRVFEANTLNPYFQTPAPTSEVKDENLRVPMVLKEKKNDSKAVTDLEAAKNSLLQEFEEKCPPGGSDSVILYTTSMRGIRKTFEDCNAVKFLLGSFRVLYDERDVSMHLEFREELWLTLGGRVIPPCLFIKGRYIGRFEEVVGLHEQGKLMELLKGIPKNPATGPCKGCGGIRFVLCLRCNGSRKVFSDERVDGPSPTSCLECNENGLVKCSVCW